jgi:hypothetical protein
MAEEVRVELVDARLGAATSEHLEYPARPQRTFGRKPQVIKIRVRV